MPHILSLSYGKDSLACLEACKLLGYPIDRVIHAEFEDSMKGIYTTSVGQSTIDESPMVYKPMEEIVKNIVDTVEILSIIKPVYNFKASE